MTAPFTRATPRRTVLAALALAGGVAAILGAVPVLADASGDGSAPFSPGHPPAHTPGAAPLRCEVALDAVRGGTEITGIVHSDRPIAGQYRMAITSRSAAGRATIRQSGAFEAAPGAPAILGETRLMGSPASQEVDLTVTIGGEPLTCGLTDL